MKLHSSPEEGSQRIRKFARAFKTYNLSLALIVASIPLGVALWDLVPLYANAKNQLTLLTSLGSYFAVGVLYFHRTGIGRLYFPRGGTARAAYAADLSKSHWFGHVPLILGVFSLLAFVLYFYVINLSIERVAYEAANSPCESLAAGERATFARPLTAFGSDSPQTINCSATPADDPGESPVIDYRVVFTDQRLISNILSQVPTPSIPYSLLSSFAFLLAFLCATSAFVLMALREFIQDQLGLTDNDLFHSPVGLAITRRFELDGVPTLYGVVEFSPADPTLEPKVGGPFCIWHNRRPEPEVEADGSVSGWFHTIERDGKKYREDCYLKTTFSHAKLQELLDQGASEIVAPRGDRARPLASAPA